MSRALACAAMVLLSAPASAETGWLSARGRVSAEPRAELFGGSQSVGGGIAVPVSAGGPGAFGFELAFDFVNRFAEARLTRAWQLTALRFATLSATGALNGFYVPQGAAALGAGAHAGLNLALGGGTFTVDVSADVGAEGFTTGPSRLPLRLGLGLNARIGHVLLSAQGRAGADVVPGRFFAVRAEAVLAAGWAW
ncbi:MAG: hypothetical protein JNK82_10585 [Myxococcaceae bacterium]|nr:hypothetical protein [Myxococcaceae bacterium]